MSTVRCECLCGGAALRYNDVEGNDVGFWSEPCATKRGFVLAEDFFDLGRRVRFHIDANLFLDAEEQP